MANSTLQTGFEPLVLCLYHETADGEVHGLGNGVLISAQIETGLALTAAHNVTYLNRIAARHSPFGDLIRTREANPRFVSSIVGVLGHRDLDGSPDVFSLPSFTMPTCNNFDIAVGLVTRRPGLCRELREQAGIKLLPPDLGETVYVLGSHSHERISATPEENTSRTRFEFRTTYLTTPAQVVSASAHHGHLAHGPAFEVNVEFGPGLSGAPVFCNRNGGAYVCGIVSSSSDGSGRGAVASIWPVLALTLPISGESGSSARVSVLDLVQRGAIKSYGDEAKLFRLHRNEDGTMDFC